MSLSDSALHAPHTEDDEGDAEQLAHVERHRVFETHLVDLQEFHEEAEGEDVGEAEAEIEASAYFGSLVVLSFSRVGSLPEQFSVASVDIKHDEEERQIGNGLVELCRMARLCPHRGRMGIEEIEAPGHRGDIADNLAVHQVTQADEAGGDACGNGDVVEHLPQGHLIAFDIEPQRQHQSQRATMGGQAFIARHLEVPSLIARELDGQQHLDEPSHRREVVLRLIEDAMAQTCTSKDADEAIEEQRVKLPVFNLLVLIQPAYREIGQCQADEPT